LNATAFLIRFTRMANSVPQISGGWLRRDTRPIWQIADGHYGMDRTRKPGEKWHLSTTPWCKEVFNDWQDESVRELVLMAAAGSAKTTPMQIIVAYHVEHDPCPIAWLTCDETLARDASEERILPMLENTASIRNLILPGMRDVTLRKIRTLHCTVDIMAASQKAAFEQNRYRVLVGDECRKWALGTLSKAENRQIGYTDAKRCFCSTAGTAGDEFHQHFLRGNRAEVVIPCQNCGQLIPFVWSSKYSSLPPWLAGRAQFKYEGDDLWLECSCGHKHHESPGFKLYIRDKLTWVDTNPEAHAGIRSRHWPIFIAPWSEWRKAVLPKWKLATQALERGNVELLREFVQETLAEPWSEGQQHERKEITAASYKLGDVQVVGGNEWAAVFMTVDVGARELHYVVRGWKPDSSRAINIGAASTWNEIREIQVRYGLDKYIHVGGKQVPLSRRVAIDARYSVTRDQNEVHLHCAKYGWTALMGEDRDFYQETVKEQKIRKLYSEPRMIDVHIGTHAEKSLYCVQFMFADGPSQDLLQKIVDGKLLRWEYPSDAPEAYPLHLGNEIKGMHRKQKGSPEVFGWHRIGAQHWRDCEKMQVVLASMMKIVFESAA
jgi:phage terminase large subunit GpA-like protein